MLGWLHGSRQFLWIFLLCYSDSGIIMWQNDLAKVDRSITPWLITILHAPWYNTNHAHQGNGDAMKADMEEVLYNANVDLVVGGHVHAYERSVSSIMFLPSSPLTLLLMSLAEIDLETIKEWE